MDITGIAKSHQADIHKAGKAHPSCRIPPGEDNRMSIWGISSSICGKSEVTKVAQDRAGILADQREEVKVSMRLYSLQELIKQYLDWGFDFASISIATQIPEEELRQLYSNENYRLRDKDKEKYLMAFLLQICCEKPNNDKYYKALLENLAQYFKIPLEAMANYIGVDIDELLNFESNSDKDRIEKCIAHLFTTFIRDSSYSV